MINPLRSEEDAFRFTVIVAVLVAPVALVAIIFSSVAALVVAGAIAIAVTVWVVLRRPQQEPEQERMLLGTTADGEPHKILVVANETLVGEALLAEIAHRSRGREAEVRVVCPALNTKLKHWVSDEDAARGQAHDRLDTMLRQLRSKGIEATGDIGDGDPMLAMEDALRQFQADEIIISTHPHGRSNWLERDVVRHARERFPLPISHVVVDLAHEQASLAGRPTRDGGAT